MKNLIIIASYVVNGILFFILTLLNFPSTASAHVGYVVSGGEILLQRGTDFIFLFSALREPMNLVIMLGTVIVILLLRFFLLGNLRFMRKIGMIKERALSYYPLVPWILRLGLGIGFIGAGVVKVLISPVLPDAQLFAFCQILLGFLFLAGFLLMPAILAGIGIFIFAFTKNFYILGNMETLAALCALYILADSRPGIDDLVGIPLRSPLLNFKKWMPFVLRLGIGGALMFLAVWEKFLNPHISELVVSKFHLMSIIPVSPPMWVLSAGLVEFLVGFLLVVGFQTRLVTIIAFLVLTLSFLYFGEGVYSHVTLFAVLSVLFVTGGGHMSADNFLGEGE